MEIFTESIKLKEEEKLFFSDKDNPGEEFCIGHLRGDFGKDGREFHTTWFPHANEKQNDECFRDVFEVLINALREKEYPLFDRNQMRQFCRPRPDCKIRAQLEPTWGFRIPTQDYVFYLRCSPDWVGDYNFYCYCYDREKLMNRLAENRGLPRYCYGYLPTMKEEIRIDFAESGYTPYRKQGNGRAAKEMNCELGITPAQAEAMKCGSMFGWNCPAADPKNYDENGKTLHRKKDSREER